MLSSDIRATPSNPLLSTAAYDVPDDVTFSLGNDKDQVILNRSSILAANTALAGVLIGTPVTPALVANSLIISNITANGDILIAGNDGGHSRTALFFDSSTPDTYLYNVGGTWTAGATAWTLPTIAATTITALTLDTTLLTVTGAELNYVSGVTSAIQTQMNLKAPLASPTLTGTVIIPTPFTIGAVSMTATGTELNLLDLSAQTVIAGELLVGTGAGTAAWQKTGVILSAPDISGTVTAASALTLPAFTLSGAVSGGAQTISNANITVGASRTLDVSAGTLTLAANQISGDKVEGGTIAAITITALTLDATLLTVLGAELNLLDLAGLTAGEVLVATAATTAAWQSTGVVLTAPTLNGTTILGATPIFDVGAGKAEIVTTGAEVLRLTANSGADTTALLRTACQRKIAGAAILSITSYALDDADAEQEYATYYQQIENPAAATPSGLHAWYCILAGASNKAMVLYAAGELLLDKMVSFDQDVDSAAVADKVSLGGYEISAGHRALAISSEEVVVTETDETKFSHKLPVRINGATYNIMLCAT